MAKDICYSAPTVSTNFPQLILYITTDNTTLTSDLFKGLAFMFVHCEMLITHDAN